MKVEVLGAHNTETDKARLPCLLVDDTVALDAGGLASSLPLERQQKIKAVLLTHHHFDHTRDLVMLGANDSVPPSTVDVYAVQDTLGVVYHYLLDGRMYKDYTSWPTTDNPRLRLRPVSPLQQIVVEGHAVLAVPVSHSTPAVGFQVSSDSGNSLFYVGNSGSGLDSCWEHISPQVLFIEVTGLDRMGDVMSKLRHLTPHLLAAELDGFKKSKGYLPRVIATHIPVAFEKELRGELASVAKELKCQLEVAGEGLVIDL
jgi:phosphoribosyl 1,2-cyclic phosphodiesterase